MTPADRAEVERIARDHCGGWWLPIYLGLALSGVGTLFAITIETVHRITALEAQVRELKGERK